MPDFEFTRDGNGHLSLEGAVYQALAASSLSWSHIENAGTYDAAEAKKVGIALIAFVRNTTIPTPPKGPHV